MRKKWADIDLSRIDYVYRPPHGALAGYFECDTKNQHYQMFLPKSSKIIRLPSFYEGLRLVGKNKGPKGKRWPPLLLDVELFTEQLVKLNQEVILSAEQKFWVWHHVVSVEYQTELESHRDKAINDAINWGLFDPTEDNLKRSKYAANVLFLPSIYNVSRRDDPRASHSYSWFCRAVLFLNYPKVPRRKYVEDAWKTVAERKAALEPDLSADQMTTFVLDWLEPVSQERFRLKE